MSDISGIGIGLRVEHASEIVRTERRLDWLEIVPEQWMWGGRRSRMLEACRERWAIVPHSTSLSIGGPDPLDLEFVAELAALCATLDAPYWSDHICYSSIGGVRTRELLPL